jgi:hypothetical protein
VGKVTFEGLAKAFFWMGCFGAYIREHELRGKTVVFLRVYQVNVTMNKDGLVHCAI